MYTTDVRLDLARFENLKNQTNSCFFADKSKMLTCLDGSQGLILKAEAESRDFPENQTISPWAESRVFPEKPTIRPGAPQLRTQQESLQSKTHIDVTDVRFGFGQISELLNQTRSCFFADKSKTHIDVLRLARFENF